MKSLSVAIAALALLGPVPVAHAEIAVEILSGASDNVFPSGGTTHGWQFSVTASIEVTHLGLYDRFLDGFALAHPVGLWDDEGVALAQDVLGPGTGDLLIDNFRYADITDNTAPGGQGVILSPGVTYTVGFYTATFVQSDGMVIFNGFHTINPLINYVGFGVSDFTAGLQMPTGPNPGFHRFGPNLQFNVVPAAGAAALLVTLPFTRRARTRRR